MFNPAQLRSSGYCRHLDPYKSRIKKDASPNAFADRGMTPHGVKHLFVCPAHPTTMIPSDLWNSLTDSVRELSYLEANNNVGVSMASNSTFDFQISNLYKQWSNLAGWILRTFTMRDRQVMLTLCNWLYPDLFMHPSFAHLICCLSN